MRAFRNSYHSSKSAQHLNEHMRTFGPIDKIIQILQILYTIIKRPTFKHYRMFLHPQGRRNS